MISFQKAILICWLVSAGTAFSLSYDVNGRLISTTAINGTKIGYFYDPTGNITNMTVTAASGSVPVLTSDLAVMGQVGVPFSFTLTSSKPSSTFTATGLPPGLLLTAGVISGTPTTAGIFSSTVVVGAAGLFSTNTLAMQMRPAKAAPTVVQQPQSQTVVLGQPVTLFAEIAGGTPLSYQWKRGNVVIGGATSASLFFSAFSAANEADYTLTATNSAGSVTTGIARLTQAQPLAMNGESFGLALVFSGNANWFSQTAVTYDGTPALRSGAIGNSQQSVVTTTVTGPGKFSFWWKVSSQSGGDGLVFNLDGATIAAIPSISGEVDWTQNSIQLASGTHTLAWGYVKNASLVAGQDAGWLANAYFTPGFNLGGTIIGQGQVIRSPAIDTFTNGAVAQLTAIPDPGRYFAGWAGDATGTANPLSVTMNAHKNVIAVFKENLGPALGAAQLAWITGGNADWFSEPYISQNDAIGAQSGAIGNSQQTWVQTTVTGKGTLLFSWKVSSETNFDLLTFSIDGVQQAAISGERDWQQRSFAIATGPHILLWTYAKDANTAGGSDAAWLDAVSFQPDAALAVILNAALRGGLFQLTWPVLADGYELQSSAVVTVAANWQSVTNVPATNGPLKQLNLPVGAGTKFFRLMHP